MRRITLRENKNKVRTLTVENDTLVDQLSPTFTSPNGQHDPRITAALTILREHQRHATELAARAVNLSPSRFRHLVRNELGVSPTRYAKHARLDSARALLATTFLSVKEVMYATGFGDASHFARDYKARFSETPSLTKQRHGQNGQ